MQVAFWFLFKNKSILLITLKILGACGEESELKKGRVLKARVLIGNLWEVLHQREPMSSGK